MNSKEIRRDLLFSNGGQTLPATHLLFHLVLGLCISIACCKAMESYVSKLQEQSFITNVQALNCAASLGTKLQKANISNSIYDLCHINTKDFSLQVGSQVSLANGSRNDFDLWEEASKLISDGLEGKLISVLQKLLSASHPDQMEMKIACQKIGAREDQ